MQKKKKKLKLSFFQMTKKMFLYDAGRDWRFDVTSAQQSYGDGWRTFFLHSHPKSAAEKTRSPPPLQTATVSGGGRGWATGGGRPPLSFTGPLALKMDTSVVAAAAAVTEISIFKNRTSFDYGPVTKWLNMRSGVKKTSDLIFRLQCKKRKKNWNCHFFKWQKK